MYVAAVIDLFSRRVVGWSMSATMIAQLVTDALVMVIWRRGISHCDAGGRPGERKFLRVHRLDACRSGMTPTPNFLMSRPPVESAQRPSESFQRLMKDHGLVCSMSRSGTAWDNAAMESFFSSIKTERIARKVCKVYHTRDQARTDVFRVYRAVLHSTPLPLDDRLSHPYGIRTNGKFSLRMVSTKPATSQSMGAATRSLVGKMESGAKPLSHEEVRSLRRSRRPSWVAQPKQRRLQILTRHIGV